MMSKKEIKPSEYPEHLLMIFYGKYNEDSAVRRDGLRPTDLTEESGIRFENVKDDLATVDRMRKKGWIVPLHGNPTQCIRSFDRIMLTQEGIDHAERLIQSKSGRIIELIRVIYVATIEGITRAFKKP